MDNFFSVAKKYKSKKKNKMHKVMSEFKNGTLKSSSGKKVTNRKQALAIAYSEMERSK